MITNITLIEALKKIKENKCIGCELYHSSVNICGADKSYEPNSKKHKEICSEHLTNKLLEVQRIATQALTPQECEEYGDNFSRVYEDNETEPLQECDVTKCRHYNEVDEDREYCQLTYNILKKKCTKKCKDVLDCYYKQLHSQQKKCQHLVLDECSQDHHNNCLGMQQCILDLEQKLNSQQKTFTVDEVKEITKLQQEKTIKEMMDLFKKIFAEFEKKDEKL